MTTQDVDRFPNITLLNWPIQPFQQLERAKRVTPGELGGIAVHYKNWMMNRLQKWDVPVLEAPDGPMDSTTSSSSLAQECQNGQLPSPIKSQELSGLDRES